MKYKNKQHLGIEEKIFKHFIKKKKKCTKERVVEMERWLLWSNVTQCGLISFIHRVQTHTPGSLFTAAC